MDLKMTDETRKKVLAIMNLAMLLNDRDTTKEVTDKKPTIVTRFYGNVCLFEVAIYENGFKYDKDYVRYATYLDGKLEEHSTDLDEIITKLTELCGKWGVLDEKD